MKTKNHGTFIPPINTAIVITCIMIAAAGCKSKETTYFQLQSYFGDVKVQSKTGESVPEIGTVIEKDQSIITGKDSLADVKCGTNGVIRINENSKVIIALLFKKSEKGGKEVRLDLEDGKMFVGLSKLSKDDNFKIKTPTAVAAIRGTSVRVTADETSSQIDVLAGKVMVNPVKEGKVIEDVEKVVEKNDMVVLDTKKVDEVIATKNIEVKKLDTEQIEQIQVENEGIKVDTTINKEVILELKSTGINSEISDIEKIKKEEKKRQEELNKLNENQRREEEEKARLQKEKEYKEARMRAEKRKQEHERMKTMKNEDKGMSIPSLE